MVVTAEDGSTTRTYTVTVTRAPGPPDPVTNIAVTHNGTSLDVTWDAPPRATAYDVTYYATT